MLAFGLFAGCQLAGQEGGSDAYLQQLLERYPELSGTPPEQTIIARVIDGDTVQTVDGQRIRLIGVNTPEVHGKAEYYGEQASAYSKEQLEGAEVYLFRDVSDTDRYGRLLRYLFVKGASPPMLFNEQLVAEGYANVMTIPPNVQFAERFVEAERAARQKGAGLWGEKEEADKADSVPKAPEAPAVDAACEAPRIKGNINSRGERIYHMPQGRYYERTIAEQMFCTAAEAEAAGFRKAKY